jgi:hypothetical protein
MVALLSMLYFLITDFTGNSGGEGTAVRKNPAQGRSARSQRSRADRYLTYSFARVSAALKMKVEDLRPRGAGWTVRLHEKGLRVDAGGPLIKRIAGLRISTGICFHNPVSELSRMANQFMSGPPASTRPPDFHRNLLSQSCFRRL